METEVEHAAVRIWGYSFVSDCRGGLGHLCWCVKDFIKQIKIKHWELENEAEGMRPRVMCWQDYPPDCCSGSYTTIITRRYLIHFSPVLKYLLAVFTLWCSCHTKPHVWCVSSQHKQLKVSLCFRSNLPTNWSWFMLVYCTFPTSSRWLWILKYYNICFLLLFSHSICSQHSHSDSPASKNTGKHETASVRAIVQIQIKQSVQMKCLHDNNKVLTLLLTPHLIWDLQKGNQPAHSRWSLCLSLFNVLTGPDLSTRTYAHLQSKAKGCYSPMSSVLNTW